MKLSSLLSTLSTTTLAGYSVIYLISKMYQPIVSLLVMHVLQKEKRDTYTKIDLSEKQHEFKQLLAISFLGQSQVFWLGSLDTLSPSQRLYWFEYLAHYRGPHKVWCHTQEKPAIMENSFVIEIPELIEYEEFVKLAPLFFPSLTATKCAQFRSLFQEKNMISSDAACMLMHYAGILSAQHIQQFIQEWVTLLVIPEHSLFTLSALFFAKDYSNFLRMWQLVKRSYSIHFWISYWSDQLFRAYLYITAQQLHDVQQAKKYAYRLPFSFIQRDWKKYTTAQLKLLHQHLYDLDFSIKQGGDEQFFDLWIYQALCP